MSGRTTKRFITSGALVLVIAVVGVLTVVVTARKRDPGPRLAVTFARYDYDNGWAVLHITNQSRTEVSFLFLAPGLIPIGGNLMRGETRELKMITPHLVDPKIPLQQKLEVQVQLRIDSTALETRIWRLLRVVGIRRGLNLWQQDISLELPPPSGPLLP